MNSSTGSSSSDPQLRIVDDYNKAEIQFATDSVQVHDEALRVSVGGLCNRSHNGARVKWVLLADESSNAPLLQGLGECRSGQFSVLVNELEQMVCGVPHRLVVEGDWNSASSSQRTASVQFEKRCQPLASESAPPPESSPIGTDCSLEYVPFGEGSSCSKVCYRESKVVFNVSVDPQRCSGLIQKLASP